MKIRLKWSPEIYGLKRVRSSFFCDGDLRNSKAKNRIINVTPDKSGLKRQILPYSFYKLLHFVKRRRKKTCLISMNTPGMLTLCQSIYPCLLLFARADYFYISNWEMGRHLKFKFLHAVASTFFCW